VIPTSLAFEHDAPARTAEHERIFGCPVSFGADATSLELSSDDLARPTLGPDPELADLLHKQADAMVAKLGPPRGAGAAFAPHTARVREALTSLLPTGDATIDNVASALGASPRSLQRRLGDEGATFQGVLDELRRELALAYLASDTHAIAEIALMLGFSDQSAFHRAFVRWTGRTPGDVRRARR
jgi:AraC-like DNA-binding protein